MLDVLSKCTFGSLITQLVTHSFPTRYEFSTSDTGPLGHSVKCLFSNHNYRVKDTFYRVSLTSSSTLCHLVVIQQVMSLNPGRVRVRQRRSREYLLGATPKL